MNWFTKTVPVVEQDVTNFIKKVELGIQNIEADAEKALQWIAGKAPGIAEGIQALEGFVVAVPGVAANPEVAAAITAANVAVAGLNAFAQTYNKANASVADQAKAVVAGYQAVNNARIAMAQANNAAVSATNVAK